MGPANYADWTQLLKYLSTAEPCPDCRRLRTEEAEVTIRKRDSPEEKLRKARKRRAILKALKQHQKLKPHDEADIEWPSGGLQAMVHTHGEAPVAVPCNPEEGKAQERMPSSHLTVW